MSIKINQDTVFLLMFRGFRGLTAKKTSGGGPVRMVPEG